MFFIGENIMLYLLKVLIDDIRLTKREEYL